MYKNKPLFKLYQMKLCWCLMMKKLNLRLIRCAPMSCEKAVNRKENECKSSTLQYQSSMRCLVIRPNCALRIEFKMLYLLGVLYSNRLTNGDWQYVLKSKCKINSKKGTQFWKTISGDPMTRRAFVWIDAAVGIYTMGINTINCVSG